MRSIDVRLSYGLTVARAMNKNGAYRVHPLGVASFGG